MAKYYPDYFSKSGSGILKKVFSLFSTVGATVDKFKKSMPKVCRSAAEICGYGSINTTYGYKVKNQCPTVNTFPHRLDLEGSHSGLVRRFAKPLYRLIAVSRVQISPPP